jgi:hypothetical protein
MVYELIVIGHNDPWWGAAERNNCAKAGAMAMLWRDNNNRPLLNHLWRPVTIEIADYETARFRGMVYRHSAPFLSCNLHIFITTHYPT